MDRSSVFKELAEIFTDVLDLDDLVLSDTTSAEDIEDWDSLSHIRLVVSIERHYSVKFSNADIESMKSVGDLVDHILAKAA